MKMIIKILLITLYLSVKPYPQFYAKKDMAPSIIEFMNIANETAKFYDNKQGLQKTFNENELKHIAMLYFKIYNEDPVGQENYINMKTKEWKIKMKENNGILKELKPSIKERILKEQIRKKYGGNFTEIISTPAFIRGKIVSIKSQVRRTDLRETNDNLITIYQTNLTIYIEDVLKGENFFKKGETMTISFITDWLKGISFKINKSYLFPLRPWISLRKYTGIVTLQNLFYKGEHTLPTEGEIDEIYPIENEVIYSKEDFFGTGKKTPWELFKNHFKNTYMIEGY